MASRPLASRPVRQPSGLVPARRSAVAAAATFTALEWSIVAMSEHAGLASLRRPNRFWRLVGLVFGIRPANRLASDRLEALRRVAVLVWQPRAAVPVSELQAFYEAGFTPSHFDQLQRRIASARVRLVAGGAR